MQFSNDFLCPHQYSCPKIKLVYRDVLGTFFEYILVKGRKNEIEHKHTCNPPPGDSQRKTDDVPQGLHDLSTQEGGFTMFVFIHKLVDSVSTHRGRRKLGTEGAL